MVILTNKSSVLIVLVLALASATAQNAPAGKALNRASDKGRNPIAVSSQETQPAVPETVQLDPFPIPAMNPEELPAKPPRVSYRNGVLAVDTGNATLGEVLNAIGKEIGAEIDQPPAADSERVVAHLSGTPRSVIASLLDDGKFGYIILYPPGDPAAVQKVVLMSQSPSDAHAQTTQTAIRRAPSNPLATMPVEAGPTPDYPSPTTADPGRSPDASTVSSPAPLPSPAVQVTPDAQLQENMSHAAQQLAEATAQLSTKSSAPDGATQPSPDSAAAEPSGNGSPMQVLQDLFQARRQLQIQQNQAQKPQQDQ